MADHTSRSTPDTIGADAPAAIDTDAPGRTRLRGPFAGPSMPLPEPLPPAPAPPAPPREIPPPVTDPPPPRS